MSSKMNGDPMKTVSLIIPAYNEEEAIPYFLERIVPLLDAEPYTFEMIFIDDGSKDRRWKSCSKPARKILASGSSSLPGISVRNWP